MSQTGKRTELYLIVGDVTPATADVLAAALDAAPAATVLLPAAAASALKPLVEFVQLRGAATLIADDARLARTVAADGVHLSWSPDLAERYAQARSSLGPDAIVGIEAGGSRHDAMVLGEAGSDYIAFAPSPHSHADTESAELQADLITWWSELFEVPCVAFGVTGPGEAAGLAFDGADFIAITLPASSALSEAAVRATLAALSPSSNIGRPAG